VIIQAERTFLRESPWKRKEAKVYRGLTEVRCRRRNLVAAVRFYSVAMFEFRPSPAVFGDARLEVDSANANMMETYYRSFDWTKDQHLA